MEPCLRILDSRGNRIPLSAVVDPPFEGAATGRRMNTWGTSTVGPNTSLYSSLNRLRSRSRELIRNNPLVQGGVDSYVANTISAGIFPSWQLGDPVLKKDIQDLWDEFVPKADYYGACSFYGLQSLALNGLIDAGEILSRKVARSTSAGLPVPLQIQLIEADAVQIDPANYFGKKKDPDSDNRKILALEPGTFPILPQGKKVHFSEPADVEASYKIWTRQQLQMEILIFQFCQPAAEAFLDAAVLSGVLRIRDYYRNRRQYLKIQ